MKKINIVHKMNKFNLGIDYNVHVEHEANRRAFRTHRLHTRDAPKAPMAAALADKWSARAGHVNDVPPLQRSYDDRAQKRRHSRRQLLMRQLLPLAMQLPMRNLWTMPVTSWRCRPPLRQRKCCAGDA